jgi:PAS domain S-box-containing protein
MMWFFALMNLTPWSRVPELPLELSCDNLVDNLPVGIALIDKNQRIVRVNHRMSQLLRRPAEELSGLFCYQQFEKGAGVCAHCPGHVPDSENQPVRTETEWQRSDGSSFWVRLTAVALRDGQGKIAGYIKMVEDITERRLLQQQLASSEARYRALFEKSGDHLFIMAIDPKQGPVIVDANEAAFKSHGYQRDELIGKPISFLDSEEARAGIAERSAKLQRPGDHLVFESEHVCKDGSLMQVEVSATVVQLGDSRPFIMCVERDISARKRAEAETRRLERQLRQAEKMEALGQLTSGIAHDFNNQLTAILGFTELLEAAIDQPTLKAYVEHIRTAAQDSTGLIDQLLAFSRKEQRASVPVDIHRVIRDVAILLKHGLGKKIGVIQHLSAPDAGVSGDPVQLQNALLNIGINARDAMAESGELLFETLTCPPPAHLSTEQAESLGNPCLCIRVQDNGCGIDEAIKARIFEPFFTTKKAGKGTGMGLASVYGAVTAHRGQIEVESVVGSGTTFQIYLPLATAAASARQQDAGSETDLDLVPPEQVLTRAGG